MRRGVVCPALCVSLGDGGRGGGHLGGGGLRDAREKTDAAEAVTVGERFAFTRTGM